MTTAVSHTPLQATLQRVAETFQYLTPTASPEVPEGWQRASEIVNSPEMVNWWLDRIFEIYGMDDRQIAASFLVLGYFWHPAVSAMACYLLDSRVPDLHPERVAMHPQQGVRFLSTRCLALPDDPAANHPDVTVVTDRDELRAQLMRQLNEEHAAPLFATLRSVAPYGLPAMRANYLDRVVNTITWLAEQLGDDDISRREVPAFLEHAGPKVRTGIIELEHQGRRGIFLKRGGCCLNYRIPGREKCDTCSLIPMEERIENLKATYLSGE